MFSGGANESEEGNEPKNYTTDETVCPNTSSGMIFKQANSLPECSLIIATCVPTQKWSSSQSFGRTTRFPRPLVTTDRHPKKLSSVRTVSDKDPIANRRYGSLSATDPLQTTTLSATSEATACGMVIARPRSPRGCIWYFPIHSVAGASSLPGWETDMILALIRPCIKFA